MRGTKRICTNMCTQTRRIKRILLLYLYVRFTCEADDHKEQDGNDIIIEAGPVVDFKGRHEGTHQHEKDCTGSENRTTCFNHMKAQKYIKN